MRSHRGTLLTVLAAAGLACAHAPASTSVAKTSTAATAAKVEKNQRVVVTGSHIPARVDPVTGLPQTTSPVKVYSRQQIDDTGRPNDLNATLRNLDPSF